MFYYIYHVLKGDFRGERNNASSWAREREK